MSKCPHCGAFNEPTIFFCASCKRNIHFKGELRPAPSQTEDKSGDTASKQRRPNDVVGSALFFGVAYSGISLVLSFVAFASGWGAALSDSYVGSSPISWFATVAIGIMHAPVFLFLWAMRLAGHETDLATAASMMLVWSFVLGAIRARLKRPS